MLITLSWFPSYGRYRVASKTDPKSVFSDQQWMLIDPLRVRLTQQGTELICPHRKNLKKPPTQDGRKLRRYKRRWKVERLNAWLQTFRRLIVRHEVQPALFQGLVHAACMVIVLRRL